MTIKRKLTSSEQIHLTQLTPMVNDWAKSNVPNEYNYNSRATYWGSACKAGIITRDEYDLARTYYDQLWDYVGD